MVLAIVMAIPLAVFLRSFPLIVVAMGLIIAGTLLLRISSASGCPRAYSSPRQLHVLP